MLCNYFINRACVPSLDALNVLSCSNVPREHIYHRVDTLHTTNGALTVLVSMDGVIKIVDDVRLHLLYPMQHLEMDDNVCATFHRRAHQQWLTARMTDDSLEPIFDTIIPIVKIKL